jgi:hypothetical protein
MGVVLEPGGLGVVLGRTGVRAPEEVPQGVAVGLRPGVAAGQAEVRRGELGAVAEPAAAVARGPEGVQERAGALAFLTMAGLSMSPGLMSPSFPRSGRAHAPVKLRQAPSGCTAA